MRVDVYSQINKMLGQIQNLLSSPSLPPLYPVYLIYLIYPLYPLPSLPSTTPSCARCSPGCCRRSAPRQEEPDDAHKDEHNGDDQDHVLHG